MLAKWLSRSQQVCMARSQRASRTKCSVDAQAYWLDSDVVIKCVHALPVEEEGEEEEEEEEEQDEEEDAHEAAKAGHLHIIKWTRQSRLRAPVLYQARR